MVGYGQQSTRETAFLPRKKISAFGMVIRNTTYSMLGRRVDGYGGYVFALLRQSLYMTVYQWKGPSYVLRHMLFRWIFPDSYVRGRFRIY